jgi:hypothetical protein
MRNSDLICRYLIAKTSFSRIVIAAVCLSAGVYCDAQAPATNPPNLSPDLQEVVTLSTEQMGEEVITNYIKSTGKSYQLTADQIIYLKNQGVSSAVLSALIQTASAGSAIPAPAPVVATADPPSMTPPNAPAPAPTAAPNVVTPPLVPTTSAPPPTPEPETMQPEVNLGYFQTQLAPFGTWVQVPGYGLCWYPSQAIAANPDWRPYYDMGHWVETDNGLFWASDYSWGDIPFHYGRWILQPGYGWLWAPDYTWGPAWVCWRQADADGFVGWAPLPVGAVFIGGVWEFRGRPVDVATFDFGLGANFFVFVNFDHFHEAFFRMRGHEWAYHVRPERVHEFYHRSVVHNDFHRDEHGRFVNDGIGRERMERLTHNRIEQAHFQERNPVGDRNRLENRRPEETRPENFRRVEERGTQRAPAAPAEKVFRPASQSQRTGGSPRQGQSSKESSGRGNH